MFLKGRDLPACSTAQLWSSLRAGMLVTGPLGCEQPRGAGGEGIPCAQILQLLMKRCSKLWPWAPSWVWSCPESPWPQELGAVGMLAWAVLLCHRRELEPGTGNPGRGSPGQGETLLSCCNTVQPQLLLLHGVRICTGVTLWIIQSQNMKI